MDLVNHSKPCILFLGGVFLDECNNEEVVLTGIGERIDFQKLENEEEDDASLAVNDKDDTLLLTAPEEDTDNDAEPSRFDIPGCSITGLSKVGKYDTMPHFFINEKTWPTTINLACWYCGLCFSTRPYAIALSLTRRLIPVDDNIDVHIYLNAAEQEETSGDVSDSSLLTGTVNLREEKVMPTRGIFCHPMCAKKYIHTVRDSKIANIWECNKLLLIFIKELTGVWYADIPEAEDRNAMCCYSGPGGMTPEEWRLANENKWKKFREILNKN